ncbi:MAG: MFS transporter [Gammaproteobacteria bacterium]
MQLSKLSKQAKAWIFYDGGNSAFATTVLAAFFPIFFKEYWSSGLTDLEATSYLGIGLTVSNLILLFTAPFIGAITDLSKTTKTFFMGLTCLAIVFVATLFFVPAGSWLMALIFFGIANYCFAAGNILYDKMIVLVSDTSNLSKISSYGFAFGYLGGGILFLINAVMTLKPAWFLLDNSAQAVQWSFLSVSVWWFIFLIPISLSIVDKHADRFHVATVKQSFSQVIDTIKKISHNKEIFIFLFSFFLYIDGVHTIMAMASDFALNLNLPSSSIIIGLILVQFVAFPSTLIWAWLANKFSDRNILLVTIVLYLLIIAYSVNLSNAIEFYILASLVGSVQGGIQAISRSFFAKIIPHEKSGEYFGFFNMFGRAGAFMGPAMVAIAVTVYPDPRVGLIPIALLFVLGGFLLLKVKKV